MSLSLGVMDRPTTFMQKRCIKLPDGRYLIFYTFDDERSGAEKELETTPRDNEDKSKEESPKNGATSGK